MPYALNGDIHIYYEVEGEGPPLILQHGLTFSLQDWREFGWVDALRREYRLVLIDARGHGESDKPHGAQDYRPEVLAADIVAVLDRLGIEKAHFFGYSWGTIIGCALAKHAPHRLWSLVLGGMNPYAVAGREELARKQFGAGMTAYLEQDSSPGLIITAGYKARRLDLDPQALIASAQRPDLVAILTGLTLPCLLYAGEAAGEYQPLLETVARIPGARFLSLPGLGHGQGFRYSHQALPPIQLFLQAVTPRHEQNRAVVRRVIGAANRADYAGLAQYYHPGWTWTAQGTPQGADGVRQWIDRIFRVFGDAEAEIVEITADEETVTTHWVFKGTHTGAGLGIAPRGARVRVSGITIDRIAHGKIVESDVRFDFAELHRQLGVIAETRG
jgi:pimeloyl-ACP methyl ester carboxylesterase/predicted ester cyclase